MSKLKTVSLGLAGAGILLISSSVFVVEQTSQALVLQFGELKQVITEPGLHFKIPFIQDVSIYEKRILDLDMTETAITTGDQKRLMVDSYTRYRISDLILFYRSVRPADERGASNQLQTIVTSSLRIVLGKTHLRDMLSEKRTPIMHQINQDAKAQAKKLGIEIIDVRIKKTEFPETNRPAVFEKMNSELEKIARLTLATGARKAKEIESTAELKRTIILAEAHRVSQKNRGEGEAKKLEIISKEIKEDPQFYNFYKTMEIYSSLQEGNTMVLSTENPLFDYMRNPEKALAGDK